MGSVSIFELLYKLRCSDTTTYVAELNVSSYRNKQHVNSYIKYALKMEVISVMGKVWIFISKLF